MTGRTARQIAVCVLVAGGACSVLPIAPADRAATLSWALLVGLFGGVTAALVAGPRAARGRVHVAAIVSAIGGVLLQTLILGQTPRLPMALVLASAAALAVEGTRWTLKLHPGSARWIGLLAAVLMLGWYAGFVPGANFGAAARITADLEGPVPAEYGFDGGIYAKTHELNRSGTPYYEAFVEAVLGDTRLDEDTLSSKLSVRIPGVFVLWRVLPARDTADLLRWGLLALSLGMVPAYLGAVRLWGAGLAMLTAATYLAVLTFYITDPRWLLFQEPWAALAVLLLVVAMLARRHKLAALAFVGAVFMRETALMFAPVLLSSLDLRKPFDRRFWPLWAGVAGAVGVIVVHYLQVQVPASGGSGLQLERWVNPSMGALLRALRFGAESSALLHLAVFVLPLSGMVWGAVSKRPIERRRIVGWLSVGSSVFLIVFGSGEWGYYWGPLFLLPMLVVVPAAFDLLRDPRQLTVPMKR